jgi:hypothetical protein
MRSASPLLIEPMPVMKLMSMAVLSSGEGLMSPAVRRITSDTESTTAPITRPCTLSTITTVKVVYSTVSHPSLMRRSTMGTITPRRFTTPLMKGGELAMRVGCS